ncbi:uncharacterized protein [Misgurnus anguillicaudatus]|uniref:uncharacterized protein n=1 Tax=Misgurnus anguillicaudatus TaxID=75329 RepID=UPI003CCF2172
MAFSLKGDDFDAFETMTGLGLGRGKFFGETPVTPIVRESKLKTTSPVLCSTRVVDHDVADTVPLAVPDITDPNSQGLITHIAQQVGKTLLASHKEASYVKEENRGAYTQGLGTSKTFSEIPSLNLTGVRLVMQSEAKEPPVYRGDASDKISVHEWEELMDMYLRKRGIPITEQHQEILSRLMGRAKDVVKVTLRCNSALNPVENPKAIMDILKQHFSDVTYSCMPLADFYGTVPLAGEDPVEYWVRLNKAVDLTEEALRRLGRRMEDPCQEAAMMFVKYCPDPTLAAVFRFKAPEKWAAQEIQEQLDRYQTELKERMSTKPKRHTATRHVTSHVQNSHENEEVDVGSPIKLGECTTVSPVHTTQSDDNCMRTLINLLDRALSQNVQMPSHQPQSKFCKVCKSQDHSTVAHSWA